jgi:hypothetical protein
MLALWWMLGTGLLAGVSENAIWPSATGSWPVSTTPADDSFLDDLQQRGLRYFVEHTDVETGLTRDRAPTDGSASVAPASVAATGFALTAWCIADQRGWLPPGEALRRVRATLEFVAAHVAHERGWLYHFVDAGSGRRAWDCEVSTVDTALFLKGAIFAREYLVDERVRSLVAELYGRIDWAWALDGGRTLVHGWCPESGFLQHRWDAYAEMMGLYLLGIGAPVKPLPADAWHAWWRGPVVNYRGRTFIQCAPLFTHQFAHAWFDFRGQRDDYADYWENSVDATLAQREWCADQSGRFSHWSKVLWGVTASDSAHGYVAWGGPALAPGPIDGTVVPCAPGGSLPFAPAECLAALREMRVVGGARVWGRYGFADAFNPQSGWVASDVIAIDQGITLVMAENLRTGLVWDIFMHAPEVKRGFRLAGFRPTAPSVREQLATLGQ